jgi:hypothetical protein
MGRKDDNSKGTERLLVWDEKLNVHPYAIPVYERVEIHLRCPYVGWARIHSVLALRTARCVMLYPYIFVAWYLIEHKYNVYHASLLWCA